MSKLIIANLKMYLNLENVKNYLKIVEDINDSNVIICPSSIYIPYFVNHHYLVGIQNISDKEIGAYTGEVSAKQAKELGCAYTIIGHSERRQNYNENNTMINQKIALANKEDLHIILCIGETKEEKDNNQTDSVITTELLEALQDNKLDNLVIAYEPIWAIGTGLIPTDEEISKMSLKIKDLIKEKYQQDIKVLYGGSVNETNINTLKEIKEIDGFLLGGVSTDGNKFKNIIEVIDKQ